MKRSVLGSILCVLAVAATVVPVATAQPKKWSDYDWVTVVNSNDLMPGAPDGRTFNSYNQPSVNSDGLVVIRARSRGGPPLGPATHGIYVRDMSVSGPITRILDRTSFVPEPNNLGVVFGETPSFPRIDLDSPTIATRGNHQPVWEYLVNGEETRAGTTGIYVDLSGSLITGIAKLGDLDEFSFWEVPEFPEVRFEVFPGAPSVSRRSTIAFKGNYVAQGVERTGVYFRDLTARGVLPGGSTPVMGIANSANTLIPGSSTVFGSTAAPSAVGDKVVFTGFDNEDAPTLGGIYLAPLHSNPPLTPLVSIGGAVPDEKGQAFTAFGEGLAFDGRHVGFWGAWGDETRTVRLYCPTEGNSDRVAYCNQQLMCAETGVIVGDPNSVCDDPTDPNYGVACYQDKQIPLHQGIFVHDVKTRKTRVAARTGDMFDEFLFWSYSGRTPCVGSGESEEGGDDDGEAVRWRSSAYVATSSKGANYRAAFKARTGNLVDGVWVEPVDGIYLHQGPGWPWPVTVVDTMMAGQALDPDAPANSTVTEVGLEREGLRGDWLAIGATMGVEGGAEEEGMAGIYITSIP